MEECQEIIDFDSTNLATLFQPKTSWIITVSRKRSWEEWAELSEEGWKSFSLYLRD